MVMENLIGHVEYIDPKFVKLPGEVFQSNKDRLQKIESGTKNPIEIEFDIDEKAEDLEHCLSDNICKLYKADEGLYIPLIARLGQLWKIAEIRKDDIFFPAILVNEKSKNIFDAIDDIFKMGDFKENDVRNVDGLEVKYIVTEENRDSYTNDGEYDGPLSVEVRNKDNVNSNLILRADIWFTDHMESGIVTFKSLVIFDDLFYAKNKLWGYGLEFASSLVEYLRVGAIIEDQGELFFIANYLALNEQSSFLRKEYLIEDSGVAFEFANFNGSNSVPEIDVICDAEY
jgi:hypothetical protein